MPGAGAGPSPEPRHGAVSLGKALTVSLLLQAAQLVGARQDVGLAPQAVPKGVLSPRHHVVEDAPS